MSLMHQQKTMWLFGVLKGLTKWSLGSYLANSQWCVFGLYDNYKWQTPIELKANEGSLLNNNNNKYQFQFTYEMFVYARAFGCPYENSVVGIYDVKVFIIIISMIDYQ